MQVCPACGRENPEGFVHCGYCAASLAAPAAERRKLATLVFCDLSGSTAIGERVDPETVRSLMLSYFSEMRGALERHGGTVEKFVGDAVLAVFGVPEAHEDDALRACRAALEMQARLGSLNEELERRYDTRIALRIGVNTGEVVAGDASSRETFVTGDAVNVAARLEQAAAPGEVLVGEPTVRLVRGSVTVEAVEPLAAKGKSEPVVAYRLLEVSAGAAPRRAATALVGREDELGLLEREFEAAVAERRCRLVTVVGEPGVGKSRLAAELVDRVGPRARAVRGGCLSYGEGITYWAVGQVVRELAGIRDEQTPEQAQARIDALVAGRPDSLAVAAQIAQLLGLGEGVTTPRELAWAVRRFLAAAAGEQPLLVLVDDIHWAEQTLLDLLAGLPAGIEDAPVLIVCLARPELHERAPGWELTVALEPLGEAELDVLLASLGAPAVLRARLTQAAAGNPLYAEELVAMLVDDGVLRREADGAWVLEGALEEVALPVSLNALLGARLDRLGTQARGTLERGAIEGELFHRGAVVELSEPGSRADVPAELEALADRDLVRPAAASFAGEAAYRFKHILVREAAYRAIAKKLRAALHEGFANWLERFARDRLSEYEEILGYHLERSYRYRAELGSLDDETRALGERAAGRLAAAGLRASARGDLAAAANLLGRAAALFPLESRERIEAVLALVEPFAALMRVAEIETLLDEAGRAAGLLGDERLTARVNVEQAWVLVHATAETWSETSVLSQVEAAIAVFDRLGDDVALARALEVVTMVHLYYGRLSEVAVASERGYRHAERAQHVKEQGKHRLGREVADQWGATPFDRVDDLLEEDLAWARQTGSIGVEACATVRLGVVRALRGDRVGGNEIFARGMSACAELGARIWAYQELGCWIWALTDDPVVAEARLRETYDVLDEAGKHGMVATVASIYAECLYRQGRDDEADAMLDVAAGKSADDDVVTQVRLRAVRAKLSARRGNLDEAEAVAREAVALAAGTEYVDLRGDSLLALAEVLRLEARTVEAAETLRRALAVFEQKGNVVDAQTTRTLLAELETIA